MDPQNDITPSNKKNQGPYKLLNLQIREGNMYEGMKQQAISFISNIFLAISEQSIEDYDEIAQNIKVHMDKLYGPPWHCIVGKGFGCGITYNNKNMLFLYISNRAILIFRH